MGWDNQVTMIILKNKIISWYESHLVYWFATSSLSSSITAWNLLFVYFSVPGRIVMQSCNSFIDDMQYAWVESIFYLWLADIEAVTQDTSVST